jgi:hypothetical protein
MKQINIIPPTIQSSVNKRIAFTLEDHGIDGREPVNIVYASWSEIERDSVYENDKNKAWRTKGEIIVDVEKTQKQAVSKLNGIDMLVLGMTTKRN